MAIAAGTIIGLGVTAGLMGNGHGHAHPHATEHQLHEVVVEAPAAEVQVHPGTQAQIRLRRTSRVVSEATEPLIYVDGVRVSDMTAVQSLDPDLIDRIEVIKGDAALELFGSDATNGVVQVFLKTQAGGSGGN